MSKIFPSPFGYSTLILIMRPPLKQSWRPALQYPIKPMRKPASQLGGSPNSRGVARNGGNRKSGTFAAALKKRHVRGLARFLGRNLGSRDSVNQRISRKKL